MSADKAKPWLKVVGIGENGLEGLSPAARKKVESAEILFGGKRHLEMIPGTQAKKIPWAKRMREAVPKILEWKGSNIVVLASGDPMCYGIGTKLLRHQPLLLLQHGAFGLAGPPLVPGCLCPTQGRGCPGK